MDVVVFYSLNVCSDFCKMVFNGNGNEIYDFVFSMVLMVLNGLFKINIKIVDMCKDDIVFIVKVLNVEELYVL